jgi:hypothetical protein
MLYDRAGGVVKQLGLGTRVQVVLNALLLQLQAVLSLRYITKNLQENNMLHDETGVVQLAVLGLVLACR